MKIKSKLSDTSFGQLEAITDNLPDFPYILERFRNGHVEYELEQGHSEAWNLLYIKGVIAVADWRNTKGTVFPLHAHEESEWFLMIEGSMELYMTKPDSEHEEHLHLGVKDFIHIVPETKHRAIFYEDSRYLAIVMPSREDWPHG